ncbi:MAG: DUF47 family protein [Candidatus Lokiarchaeota archaeon]|nr:DUF47 family protein [Candidatus Lokiarchaeota archaeon]
MPKKELKKMKIDEITQYFMNKTTKQNMKLIRAIDHLIIEDFEEFEKDLKYVIDTKKEEEIKRAFESKIWKSKMMFSKADRVLVFNRINKIRDLGETLARRMLLYRVVFPDEQFKNDIKEILELLKTVLLDLASAVKSIGKDLEQSYEVSQKIKNEHLKLRNKAWELLSNLYNYEMDFLSRTFLYLKDLIEGIVFLADEAENFAGYLQFLATKYLIFE